MAVGKTDSQKGLRWMQNLSKQVRAERKSAEVLQHGSGFVDDTQFGYPDVLDRRSLCGFEANWIG